ncbi:iron complex transport system permease protein [Motilibacter peucedani]|uniref:Iron complex transport system permease protein n=1 Tax=Motilibacter peucedani TaxID=598650 RepID=A0A420XUL9_9ACTN|nr:iron chelate uptake ABC transporter family permease subunit [Motilibacter peucedani]RKS80525.1 iron complex transport system permease protein [Motilibacter peucedani]
MKALVARPHPRVSVRLDTGALVAGGLLTLVALAAGGLALTTGDYPIGVGTVADAVLHRGDPGASFVVNEIRLPRTVAGLCVGAALGVSGALSQAVSRNPLASPDVLGVTAGAAAAAVASIVLGSPGWLPVSGAALAGGLGAAALVLVVSATGGPGGLGGARLVLVGIGFASLLSAVTSWLLVRAGVNDAVQATAWLTGSLNGRSWADVRPVALGLVLLLPVTWALARHVRLLELDPDTARALGERTTTVQLLATLVSVCLAALATAAAGPVAFVALVAPHVARRLGRTPGVPLVLSAATGAALVALSDLVAHRGPVGDPPVGVVTAVAGAPVLVWLLRRSRQVQGL